jgi:hypothetical protein
MDDYAVYNKIAKTEGVTQFGRFSCARRKFNDDQIVASIKKGKLRKADMAVKMIAKLYGIEKTLQEKAPRSDTRFGKKKVSHN